MVQRWIN